MQTLIAKSSRLLRFGLVAGLLAVLANCGQQPEPPKVVAPAPKPVQKPVEVVKPGFDPSKPVTIAFLSPGGTGNTQADEMALSLVNAARLAVEDIRDAQIVLKIYPTAQNPEQAQQAARKAIAEGAQMIIGPVSSTSVIKVSPVARKAKIPVISLSNNIAVAGNGTYVMGMTYEDTADRLISHIAQQGVLSTGVVYPETAAGNAALKAAERAARTNLGSVSAKYGYERSVQGIQNSSEAYVKLMHAAGAQAVVLGDSGSGLVQAAAFFPYHEALMQRRKEGEPAPKPLSDLTMLSLENLNQPVFLSDPNLQGALFAMPDPELSELFDILYEGAYGEKPHPLAALAYDAVGMAGTLIARARETGDRLGFAATNIEDPFGFAGVNGTFRFSEDGHIHRGLAVMEVARDGAKLLDPAPRRFDLATR